MGLSGGTNTFELSGDVRDPTAVVLARIRKAQFARLSAKRSSAKMICSMFCWLLLLVCLLILVSLSLLFHFSLFCSFPASQEGADGCQEC